MVMDTMTNNNQRDKVQKNPVEQPGPHQKITFSGMVQQFRFHMELLQGTITLIGQINRTPMQHDIDTIIGQDFTPKLE